jgi:hypothetical protein
MYDPLGLNTTETNSSPKGAYDPLGVNVGGYDPLGINKKDEGFIDKAKRVAREAFTSYAESKARIAPIAPKTTAEVSATLISGVAALAPAVGSMLIPTPERVKELGRGKIESDVGKELNARLERAKNIVDIGTYQPKSVMAQKALEPVSEVMGYIPEKAAESTADYEKWAEEAAARGDYGKATFHKTVATILPISAEAANLYLLGEVGKAAKIVKKVSGRTIDTFIPKDMNGIIPEVQGKSTSITPEVTRQERVSPEFTKSVLEPKDNTLQIEQKKDFVLSNKNNELIDAQAKRFEETKSGKKVIKPKYDPLKINEIAPEIKAEQPSVPVEKVQLGATSQAEGVVKTTEGTGIKNEVVDAERKARGLDELERHGVTNADQEVSFARAKELVDSGERNPKELANKIIQNKDYQVSEVDIYKQIEEAQKKGDIELENRLIEERGKIESDLAINDKASGVSGTQWSNIGKARQRMISEDYSLTAIIRKARTDKGAELTSQERVKYESFAKEIETANEKIKLYEEKIAQFESQKTFKQIVNKIELEARKTKRTYRKEELNVEFDALSKELNKSLSGLHANPFADPKAIKILGQMAENRVRSGLLTVEGVIDGIYTSVKNTGIEVSKKDIRDAISGYGRIEKKVGRSELTQKINELKKQMKLISKLEDIKNGKVPEKQSRTINDSPEVTELKKQIKELEPKATTEEVSLKSYKKRTANKIKELEDRIQRGDFEKTIKKETKLDGEALKLYHELDRAKYRYNEARVGDINSRKNLLQKTLGTVAEVANLTRSLKASMDVSAVLRQGLFFSVSHPIISAKSIPQMLKSFANDKYRFQAEQAILKDPNYKRAIDSKLELTDIGSDLSHMEETFMSKLASKIPGVAGSQRAYTTFLNKTRMDIFNNLTKNLVEKEGSIKPIESQAIATLINEATGRGSLGTRANAWTGLNTIFFAPRLVASRFQMLVGHSMWKGTRASRILIAKEYGRFLSGIAAIYVLAELAGNDTEFNVTSTELGKIRVGNTHIDPLAGLSQAIVFMGRMATGETKDYQTGITTSLINPPYGKDNIWDIITRFARTKLAPSVGTTIDVRTGEDVVGKKTTWKDIPEKAFAPMPWTDTYEAMVEHGVPKGMALGILSMLGVGVATYSKESDWSKNESKKTEKLKKRIGEEKFQQLNDKYNKTVQTRIDTETKKESYQKLDNDKKRKRIEEIRRVTKNQIIH